jgi:amidase
MAHAIRRKELSASELVEMTFRWIDRHNPAINAITWLDRERAVARAKEADRAIAKGEAPGALHGVPVTIKDAFAYRGSPNAWGLPQLKDPSVPAPPSPSSVSSLPARSSPERPISR